ncbi:uncharacterized protein HD556DRAFT_1446937 [Suillus plorans]|uniref:Uncharacterized protein n=1 Tax=Suillus plorans TaxID=116603 RepID=A0A9P7AHF0_9AGAM|nr:uncharacterized protein HD556DRAFT_1446937 [Suillus plorans]KAG1789532.1 hypothetical protein HD556DRAFT_1446937 [Suillus plorans]
MRKYNSVATEATLVPDDFSVSQRALCWNNSCRYQHAYESSNLGDGCSEHSVLISAIPVELTVTLRRVVSQIMYTALNWIGVTVITMLEVIMVARLHTMYQHSRKVLIILLIAFLAVGIVNIVVAAIMMRHFSAEELVLSGTYQCAIKFEEDVVLLGSISWTLGIAWEVLTLCLTVRIAVKHFRELQRHSAGQIIKDCFTVLLKTHVGYFASMLPAACLKLGYMSPMISADKYSPGTQIYLGFLQIFTLAEMFVLGPHLILSVREYHTGLMAHSDAGPSMIPMSFQERVHISTGGGV